MQFTRFTQNDTLAVEDVSIEDFLDNGFSEPPVPDDTLETLAPTATQIGRASCRERV